MTLPVVPAPADAERAAATAARTLHHALARVGITLPALAASHPAPSGQGQVHLGGCTAGTAARLAEIVTAAADADPTLREAR